MNNDKAEKLGNAWLKNNGITQKQFNQAEIWQLQALKTTNYLMKHKTDLLTETEQDKLLTFYWAMSNNKQRQNITKKMTYEVMNIGAKIRRKEFKAKKKQISNCSKKVQKHGL